MKLNNMLSREGYRVFQSGSVEAVKDHSFSGEISLEEIDLALIDLYFKGEDGFDLLKYLKSNYPDIKIVIVSMEARKEKIKKAINLGADNYITKPFDKRTLLQKVNLILSSKKQYKKEAVPSKDFNEVISNLKTDLSMELSRSIRSGLDFAVVRLNYLNRINSSEIIKLKSNITSKIRDIDRIYYTSPSEYTFLLPLTDREGVNIFVDKIMSEFDENINDNNGNIQVESMVFPEEIINEADINYDMHKEYLNKLLTEIEID